MPGKRKPMVIITGSAGNVGSALSTALKKDYRVVGFDLDKSACDIAMDMTSESSIEEALREFKKLYGKKIDAVIHLCGYFDFTGEDNPLYDKVNVEGTELLLKALQKFNVGRFVYSSTMLVHKPAKAGETISETTPIKPGWAYPKSKAKAEKAIKKHHGKIPYTILRLAGVYDNNSAVPTLTNQIARIYEKGIKSYLYAGNMEAGQSFIHREDLISLFKKTIDKRNTLPKTHAVLAGEPGAESYRQLQNTIGRLIHGRDTWDTLRIPETMAKLAAWLQEKSEPAIPDDFDQGEKPFIRSFMVDMASDNYALDISKARHILDWEPKHTIRATLPKIIKALKKDPAAWYKKNSITPPDWLEAAEEEDKNPEKLRKNYEDYYQKTHAENIWAHFLTIGLGVWLITAPFTLGYESQAMIISDIISGGLICIFGFFSLSGNKWLRLARFDTAIVGLWLLFAPLVFWSPEAASYFNDTIVGALVIGFAMLTRPFPIMSPAAAMSGPDYPADWSFSPSSWFQRMPIIILAFVGFFISSYLTAYQLGYIDKVWEPFFPGALPDAKNGTEEIITSYVSKAWPVPDAGLGAVTYMLEILTGIIGSRNRWRTMPWLVLLFGFMIVPLGAVSITFIIIQPILLDTWCTLCLIAAAAMLLQIPYSFDEIVATIQFLVRRRRAGRPLLKILFTGDIDEKSKKEKIEDNFCQKPLKIIRQMLAGGISVSWNMLLCMAIGIWLMFTRITVGSEGGMVDADHLIGALVLTISVTAFAEVIRPIRFLNIFLGMALFITPFIYSAGIAGIISSLLCGFGLIIFSIPKGPVHGKYGNWNRAIV